MMNFQEIIDVIETLSVEDQERLFELIRKRRIEAQRTAIKTHAMKVFQEVKMGTDKRGDSEDLKAYLLEDKEATADHIIHKEADFDDAMNSFLLTFDEWSNVYKRLADS